jgi:hypothetical protein
MASEKLDVAATTDSYIKEVGGEGIDAKLQGRDLDLSPAEAARGNMLEVRLLNCDGKKRDKTDRATCRGTSTGRRSSTSASSYSVRGKP